MRSTVASQQEGRVFKSRIVQHVGACSRAFLCGVCMFSPCSPGFPPLNPNNKNMQKEQMLVGQMLVGPVPDQVRTEHLDLVPGRHIAGRPLLLDVPGGGCQDGKKAENIFHRRPTCMCVLCVCVCVCVSPLTMCVKVCACRVAIKRPCPPDFISNRLPVEI